MKVLHVAGTMGTIILFRLPLLEKLNERGISNWIAANKYRAYSVEDLEKQGITFFPVLLRSNGVKNYIISLYRLIKLIRKEKFEIVHTNTPLGGIVGRLAAILSMRNIKIFHTTGGIPISPKTTKLSKFLYFKIEKFLAARTDYIFCPSRIDINIYKSKGLRPKNEIVHCGPAGFDPKRYPISEKQKYRSQLLEELGFEPDTIIIGIVGRVVADKGIYEFLRVAEEITITRKKVKFIIVGNGPLFEKLSNKYKSNDVRFLGRRNDVPKIMLGLDIFLFPSHREGYPVAVLEAMAGQTPVIGFDIDGCKEAIVNNKDGILVPFGDVSELKNAVEFLIENESNRVEMGVEARNKVKANCTKEHHIDKHFNIYKNYIA